MMDQINLLLADRNQLFREGLKRLLEEKRYTIVAEAKSLAEGEAELPVTGALDLVVFEISGADGDATGAAIERIRRRHPGVKIAVLTSDQSRDAFAKAVGWSVDAYLLKDMSTDALVRSFEIVQLGQQIFPTSLMMSLMRSHPAEQAGEEETGIVQGLSRRELQILQSLVSGHSNKAMARDLCISEATIKVHLKSLLRKMRVKNRTQAAVWALNNGIVHKETMHVS
jgi:two-component system, NarL family, nitrate/nitrite response regulator NarL